MSETVLVARNEEQKREKLKREKPQAHEKVRLFAEKIQRGESIAILQFQFDYRCNFRCSHCSISDRTDQGRTPLRVEEVAGIARQAHGLGLARWVLTGGEPLISPRLEPFVEALEPARWYISCDSNGWLLDLQRAFALKRLGIDRIQLSIDGLGAEQHDAFRRARGSHQRCMRAIDATLKAGLDLFIQTVVTKKRLRSREFIDFIAHFTGRGIDVFVTFAKPVGSYKGCFDEMIDLADLEFFKGLQERYRVFSHLTPAYGLSLGCPAVKNILTITEYGDVLGCQYTNISLGNLREEPLAEIIRRGAAIRWYRQHIETCPPAMDREYVRRTYSDRFPIPWQEFFREEEIAEAQPG